MPINLWELFLNLSEGKACIKQDVNLLLDILKSHLFINNAMKTDLDCVFIFNFSWH